MINSRTIKANEFDVTVSWDEETGEAMVQIDAEPTAEFCVYLNEGRLAKVAEGGDLVDRFDDGMSALELLDIIDQAGRRCFATVETGLA
jgi:hypothetical protein